MKRPLLSAMLLALPMLAFAQLATQAPTVLRDSKGTIRAIEFSEKDAASNLSDQAFLQQYLRVTDDDAFVKARDKQRRPDYVNDHLDQVYKGVKVDGGGYNFHYKAGKIYYAHGHFVKLTNFDVKPAITAQTARDAWAAYKKIPPASITDFTAELLIKEIAPLDSAANLVYKIYLRSTHPANDEVGYVQAKTGHVVLAEPILTHASPALKTKISTLSSRPAQRTVPQSRLLTPATGTFVTRYSGTRNGSTDNTGSSFRLFDQTRGATIHTWNLQGSTNFSTRVELTDNDNNWTTAEHSGNANDMALDVHWAIQQIYDRLNNAYGINSFDDPVNGPGTPINAHIRYGTFNDDRDNAFWDLVNNILYFGEGAIRFRPVASVDAVAHEFGHGITDFQIGWAATGIQGAFNEGLSDIWGAIMQHRITGGNVWQIGEQLTLNNPALRDLQNTNLPNVLQPMANTFGSTQYNSDQNIYVRSGVLSHWAYILANGGVGINGVSNGYSVNGIGMDKLENLIVHAVFNNFLDNTTSYEEVRNGMINAATALYGACSDEVVAANNAWYTVGLGKATGPAFGKYSYGTNTYAFSGSTGISVSNSAPNIYIELADYGPGATYTWTVNSQSGNSSRTLSGRNGSISLSGGSSLNVTCSITNTCGSYSVSFNCYNYSGGFRMAAYPNPANQDITIATVKSEYKNDTKFQEEDMAADQPVEDKDLVDVDADVRLLNKNNQVLREGKLQKGKLNFAVAKLPDGIYYLHMTNEDRQIRKQIVVQH